jgi:CBS domain-containing protein
MPFIVESIVPSNQKLVSVNIDDSAQLALERMVEHDFTQLPVIDHQGKLEGLITSDSILKALSFFKTTVDHLQVSHAIVKVKIFRRDEDISDLLRDLKDLSAVAIVDKQGKPESIVTSFDTTEYFRARAEDIMLAEDIETTLRDLIESFYRKPEGNLDEEALKEAIIAITPSDKKIRNGFEGALKHYLNQSGATDRTLKPEVIDAAFQRHLHSPTPSKKFEKLTLYDLVQLLKNVWEQYQAAFGGLSWDKVSTLLDAVRDTRNDIAHFRNITPQQREQLKFCATFLDRHSPSLEPQKLESWEPTSKNLTLEKLISLKNLAVHLSKISPELSSTFSDRVIELAEKINAPIAVSPEALVAKNDSAESRYAPLAEWLHMIELDKVTLNFAHVEGIIQDSLPASARKHRNWWANDSVGHVQSKQWLKVGWRVSDVSLAEEIVVFSRISERKAAYTSFFNSLQPKLEAIPDLSVKLLTKAQGEHWVTFEVAANNAPVATYRISFVRGEKLHIGQYIARAERTHTEQIFDHLYQNKAAIEADFGGPLTWERLIGPHRARVAVYRDNSAITDPPETWEAMQTWLVETLPGFYHAFAPRYQAALDATQPPSGPSI